MGVTLREIREEDLENIMRWRMAPDITRYMNTNPELTLEGQKKWLDSIRRNPDVMYWLIQVEEQPAGVINLTGLENPEGRVGWAYSGGRRTSDLVRSGGMMTQKELYARCKDRVFDQITLVTDNAFTQTANLISIYQWTVSSMGIVSGKGKVDGKESF